MASSTHIVGISGSLRAESRNTAVLRWAQANAPEGVTIDIADISDFPLYNRDLEDLGFPASVRRVQLEIQDADGVLFATPEYNFSVTGPLKNAIDWLSRPPQPMWGKPAAMFGVAGRSGSMRSQLHLREMLLHDDVLLVTRPQVLIKIGEAFEGSEFTNARAQEQVIRLVDALRALALHRAVSRRRVLVVGRDPAGVSRAVKMLAEVVVDAIGVTTEDEAITEIEAGDLAAVLVQPDVNASTRSLVAEVATAAGHLPVVDVPDPEAIARAAVETLHM